MQASKGRIALLLALAMAGVGATVSDDPAIAEMETFIQDQHIDKAKAGWKIRLNKPPRLRFPKGHTYYWNLETSQGTIKIKLLPQVAPMHVSSTIYLTLAGFYDGTRFHRVIPGFMAQGGDPLGNGTGGPGYAYSGEFDPATKHDKAGVLSMANRGPDTDGSQFFLTFGPTPHLDGKHTVFGEVVDGQSTLKALESKGTRSGRPTAPLTLKKATITVEDS